MGLEDIILRALFLPGELCIVSVHLHLGMLLTRSFTGIRFVATNFIDGTVEGTPADLKVYIDSSLSNDHTYYGNGCSGFKIYSSPCASSIVKDGDNEDQKIGVYYNFQASTVGSGAAITTDNTNSPDTFCPLGWQLPYSGTDGDYYDKSKSNDFLFNTYGIADSQSGANQFRSYPFSYILSGRIRFETSGLRFLDNAGFLWPITIGGPGLAFRTEIWDSVVRYADNAFDMNFGYNVRCICKLASGCNNFVYALK